MHQVRAYNVGVTVNNPAIFYATAKLGDLLSRPVLHHSKWVDREIGIGLSTLLVIVGLSMFTRKISKRIYKNRLSSEDSAYASISIPSDVADLWAGSESVAICYDRDLNVLFLTPIGDDHDN